MNIITTSLVLLALAISIRAHSDCTCPPSNVVSTADGSSPSGGDDEALIITTINPPDNWNQDQDPFDLFATAQDEFGEVLFGVDEQTLSVNLPGTDDFCLNYVKLEQLRCNAFGIKLFDGSGNQMCNEMTISGLPTDRSFRTMELFVDACCCGVARVDYLCTSDRREYALKNAVLEGCITPEYCPWSAWECDVTCGTGIGTRTRTCECDNPDITRFECGGDPTDNDICEEDCCQEPPHFDDWSVWGPCNETCGPGFTTRSRICVHADCPDGTDCVGEPEETTGCEIDCCREPAQWSDWGQWEECPIEVGIWNITRTRICVEPTCWDQIDCNGHDVEQDVCENKENCVCRVRGDPIVSDCDGQLLTLRGEGYFEIASSSGTTFCPAFASFVKNEIVEANGLVIPTDLFIILEGKLIHITRDMEVFIDGAATPVTLPYTDVIFEVSITLDTYIRVQIGDTCDIEFAFLVEGDFSKTVVQIPGSLFDDVTGICGNFNGDPDDDLALEDGTPDDDRNEISDSYRREELPV